MSEPIYGLRDTTQQINHLQGGVMPPHTEMQIRQTVSSTSDELWSHILTPQRLAKYKLWALYKILEFEEATIGTSQHKYIVYVLICEPITSFLCEPITSFLHEPTTDNTCDIKQAVLIYFGCRYLMFFSCKTFPILCIIPIYIM